MSLTASQAGEYSQTSDPEHKIVSSILTDLIFRRNHERIAALSEPSLNRRRSRDRAMRFKTQNRQNNSINSNINLDLGFSEIKDKTTEMATHSRLAHCAQVRGPPPAPPYRIVPQQRPLLCRSCHKPAHPSASLQISRPRLVCTARAGTGDASGPQPSSLNKMPVPARVGRGAQEH